MLIANFYEGRGVCPGDISGPNLERLQQHAWPGNVRELRNVLERAWALSGGGNTGFSDLRLWMQASVERAPNGPEIDTALPFKDAKERWNNEFECRYLNDVFEQCERNITHAAQHSGINRRHFRTLLRKHAIIDS